MNLSKRNHIRSRKILDAANGETCTYCGRNDGTTVAAHSDRQHDGKGMSIKADDIFVAFMCATCHEAYGKRVIEQEGFHEAMKLTWRRLFERGILKIG